MQMTVRKASIGVFLLNILAIVVALIVSVQGGRDPFGERGYITFFSTFQLLAIAWLSGKTLQTKKKLKPPPKKSVRLFWTVISVGFIFLAADEFFSIHELTDIFIHDLFRLQETPVTDQIDDAIVALYGIVGAVVVWTHRDEIKGNQRAIAFLKWSFFLLAIMVILDFVSNDEGFLERFFDPPRADLIQGYLYQLEDSLKILAEACLVSAFYAIWVATKSLQNRLGSVYEDSSLGKLG